MALLAPLGVRLDQREPGGHALRRGPHRRRFGQYRAHRRGRLGFVARADYLKRGLEPHAGLHREPPGVRSIIRLLGRLAVLLGNRRGDRSRRPGGHLWRHSDPHAPVRVRSGDGQALRRPRHGRGAGDRCLARWAALRLGQEPGAGYPGRALSLRAGRRKNPGVKAKDKTQEGKQP